MDRNREARRSTMAATNGLSRRRHRTTSLRESPEADVAVELQETGRLRDRGSGKKDRERERDRLSRSKRRRADRLMHGSNREDVGEESSEESVNDDEDDEDEDCGASVRMLPPNPSISNHRKTFPLAKTLRTAATWKAADEMIGVSVPRKARSVSTKRSHDSWTPTAGVGSAELIHRQPSTSPARSTLAPASPSSSNASARKKPKRPPKVSSKSSSAQDEIEIEIAEVLYRMMRQPQGPSKQDISISDSREVSKSTTDAKSRVSSPISNSSSALPLPSLMVTQNSASIVTSMSAIAPKRKRPRPIKYEDENPSSHCGRNGPIFSTTKPETDQSTMTEIPSHNLKKSSEFLAENGRVSVNSGSSHVAPSSLEEVNVLSDIRPLVAESNGEDLGVAKEEPQSPKNGAQALISSRDEMTSTEPHSSMAEFENQREDKFQIDLMAPPSRSSPEKNSEIDFVAVEPRSSMVTDAEPGMNKGKENDKASKIGKEEEEANVEAKAKSEDADSRNETESGHGVLRDNKLNRLAQKQHQPSSISDKSGQANSLPLPMSVAGWPNGLPPIGYVTPLQGVVSMDGTSVTSTAAIQPQNSLFPPARLKRCASHCYIARNICYHQQIVRMNPYWAAAPGSVSMVGAKPCNLSPSSMQDRAQSLPTKSGKDSKSPNPAAIVGVSQRKQILVQQSLPPGAPSNILGPAFIFPVHQQQAAAVPGSVKSPSAPSSGSASIAAPTMSFNYPNEAQYLAFLQNNGYSFPIPSHVGVPPGYRGAHPPPSMPFFNGSFYSSQMIHPQPSGQTQLGQQGSQSSVVGGSGGSSNQKHLQSQQPRSHSSGVYGAGGNLQGFSSKNQAQPPRPQLLESEITNSTQNFPMPSHPPPNFAVINPLVPISSSGKKKHSQPQGGSKTGVEPAQAFALSFASMNGASTSTGIDLSPIAPNHPMSQSIAFSRTDLLDAPSVSTAAGGTTMVVDSLARRPSGSTISPPGTSIPQHHHMQRNQQQIMLQKQQPFAARNKVLQAISGGGSVYSDQSSSAMAAKFADSLSSLPQNLAQSNATTSPAQSPQWKNSVRAASQFPTRPVSSPSSTKNHPQQPNRPQQSHTQISFAANSKSSLQNQAPQAVISSQAPSPPLMVGSPTSSVSKSSGGSPRLVTSTTPGTKTGQAPMSTSQQIKTSPPLPTQKSILGNPHGTSSSISGGKTQQQAQQQQHLSKQPPLQQAQLFFSHPYMQAQASHSTSPSAAGGYYLQRRPPEPLPAATQGQSLTMATSGGMLSLCSPPITLNPAKVVAGAVQVSSSGFPYIHAVSPAAVQVKPTEKQPAGE